MPTYVWSDLWGAPVLVGAAEVEGREGIFRYAPIYLESSHPPLDPLNLPLRAAEFHTRANAGVFGVLADAGPDAWGRRVLTTLHPKRMATATPLDMLALAGGHGTGVLLFSQSRSSVAPRPHTAAIEVLGAAAEGMQTVELGEVPKAQLQEVLKFGTGVGGVHPKIAVHEHGHEWIAKFRSRDDLVDTPRLEVAVMKLARSCGIDAAEVRLSAVGEKVCALVRRFDRSKAGPLHYASAHALWNAETVRIEEAMRSWASYMGIADLLRLHVSADPKADCEQLFRRMVFNVVIGNTDDHGKNHGFLMTAEGQWRLAPAFDLIPPIGSAATEQALGIGLAGRERSFDNLLSAVAKFGLSVAHAKHIVKEIDSTVAERYTEFMLTERMNETDRAAAAARVLLPAGGEMQA